MTIWVIDDNPLHSMLIKSICKALNIKCKCYLSYKEAVEEVNKFARINKDTQLAPDPDIPELVFIDLVLEEGKRGEEIIHILKEVFEKNEKGKEVKFVAFTADMVSRRKLSALGFNHVIYKPVLEEKISTIIRRTLRIF